MLACTLLCSCAEIPDSLNNSKKTGINVIDSSPKYTDYTESYDNESSNIKTTERGNLDIIRNQLENDLKKHIQMLKLKMQELATAVLCRHIILKSEEIQILTSKT